MKAFRIHSFGDSDQIHLEDAPRPEPQSGQVVARVYRAGINPVDWKVRAGRTGHSAQFPLTLGQDFAGEITDSGSTDWSVGERVFGFASDGAYAEYVSAEMADIARIPPAMSYETAAALPTPGVTAYQMIAATGLKSGQTVLIHGGAGAVGSLALQLAQMRGARIAATALTSDDIAYLRELGAEVAINARQENFEDRVRDMDLVMDLVGGETQQRSFAVLKPGGLLITSVGGLDSSPAEDEARRRGIRTLSFRMKRSGADLAEVARLVASGPLRLRVAQVLPFDQARRAQDLTEQGDTHGKVVLRVA